MRTFIRGEKIMIKKSLIVAAAIGVSMGLTAGAVQAQLPPGVKR